jgi:hypothetical protein
VSGLVVRREQMQVLEAYALEQFVTRMAARLRELFPCETAALSPPALQTLIREGVEKAESHAVTDESDVERYLEYVVRYGADFDSAEKIAWAGAVLRRSDLSGAQKMDALDDHDLFGAV